MDAESRRAEVESRSTADLNAGLSGCGLAVQDGYLTPVQIRGLGRCAAVRRERGDFGEARIGSGRLRQRRADVRGDNTCWLVPATPPAPCAPPPTPLFPEEEALVADLERLRLDLNRHGYLGLFDLELHHAWYPPGAGYARHVDQLDGRGQRVVSLVLYLNDAWPADAGGELRLFDGPEFRDIAPVAGRLVCFLSAGREHQVLQSRRDRYSIAGWFRRRDTGRGA